MAKSLGITFATTRKIRDRCLCLHVQRAARAIGRHFDEALRPLGLTNGQFSLLVSLNRREPATIGSVARLLAVDRTTLTAALKPLERRGLIEATIAAEDKRSRVLILTAAGRSVLAAAVPVWKRAHAEAERLLGGADPEHLRQLLRALAD